MAVVAFWISSVAAPALQQRRVHKALRLLFAVRDPRWIPPPNASSSAETQSDVANDELLTATLTQYWTSSHTDRRRRGRLARSDAHHLVRSPTTAESGQIWNLAQELHSQVRTKPGRAMGRERDPGQSVHAASCRPTSWAHWMPGTSSTACYIVNKHVSQARRCRARLCMRDCHEPSIRTKPGRTTRQIVNVLAASRSH